MSYKSILVHLDDHKSCAGRILAAIALAQTHDAHLTGLYVAAEPALPGSLRAEIPPDFMRTILEQQQDVMATAKRSFVETATKAGLNADCRTVRTTSSLIASVVSLHARYADLVVLGQPESDARGETELSDAEDVVMAAGRPSLIIPYIGAGDGFGRRAMVAWDGGREAARAVGDAMPMLEKAESVAVVVVNPKSGDHGAEPGADIALHLARHGIKVEAQHLEARDMSVADTILSRAADQSIDLLVMGAYGHSRFREWVLGGATRQIFAQMTVPVLMSH